MTVRRGGLAVARPVAIRGEDGVSYDPTNLPPAFHKDGLKVEAAARRRDDMRGIHLGGRIVQIVRIRAR